MPRPDWMPARMRSLAAQAQRGPELRTGWPGAPRPELLPGMGRPRVGMLGGVAQQRTSGGVTAAAVPDGQLRLIGSGKALEPRIRTQMEGFFGADFSGVRVHEGPAAQAMGALAFTLGETLYFAPGLYDPTTREGLELLGHELAHVVQQRDGRVANPYGRGVAIVQDPALEAEADSKGRQVAEEILGGVGQAAARRRVGAPPWLTAPLDRVLQNSTRKESDYHALLTRICGEIDYVMLIKSMLDKDHKSIADTSAGFYDSHQFTVAKKVLAWEYKKSKITGNHKAMHYLQGKKVLVVVTSHGGLHWLFGDTPDEEDTAVSTFHDQLQTIKDDLECTFVGGVLDACWTGTELHASQRAIACPSPARLLSALNDIPVFGFDGKVSSSLVKYYDKDRQPKSKDYSEGCLIFRKGECLTELSGEQVWHTAEDVQKKDYYLLLFNVRPAKDGFFRSQ